MKVIFLGVDGVLNSKGTSTLDETYINRLKQIINETGAKVVLASSWKNMIYYPDMYDDSEKIQLDELMSKHGIEFIGLLPDLSEDKRDIEVLEWMSNKRDKIESFVIIDDLPNKLYETFPDNFVRTGGYLLGGISDKNVKDAVSILNKQV